MEQLGEYEEYSYVHEVFVSIRIIAENALITHLLWVIIRLKLKDRGSCIKNKGVDEASH